VVNGIIRHSQACGSDIKSDITKRYWLCRYALKKKILEPHRELNEIDIFDVSMESSYVTLGRVEQ
jgi:hypothetical protein